MGANARETRILVGGGTQARSMACPADQERALLLAGAVNQGVGTRRDAHFRPVIAHPPGRRSSRGRSNRAAEEVRDVLRRAAFFGNTPRQRPLFLRQLLVRP